MLHYTSLLCMTFVSLVCANECVHVHDKRNFPQAKLDSEINVLFLLNKHGDLYFLLCDNSVHIILLNFKKKIKAFLSHGKNGIGESFQKTMLWNANYDHENNDYMNALCLARCFKWYDFSTNFI